MKDSNKKSKKSSSDSVDPVKNTIPEMPKDKRTKAYKEWVKKYGDLTSESNVIPEMPKDKRTKAYKEWVKQYGDQELPKKNQKTSSKSDKKKTKKIDSKKVTLSDNIKQFEELINSNEWFTKRKEIEELRSVINTILKKNDSDNIGTIKSDFFKTLKIYSSKKRKYFNDLNSNQKENLIKKKALIEKIKDLIVVDENPNKLYTKFKLLKEDWHTTGRVPITERNNI